MTATKPTAYIDGVSSLRVTGLQPHIITGVFLQILREHFIDSARIENEYIKDYVWVPRADDLVEADPELTRIIIDPVYRWDRKTTQNRPGIIIKRGALKSQRVGIGMNRYFGLGEKDYPEAGSKHSNFYHGSHVIFCIARDGGAAEVLAAEVERHITHFAVRIKSEFGFKDLELVQIGEVAVLEEEAQNFVVPVVFKYAFENTWTLVKQEPRLKGIAVSNKEM